MKQHIKRSLALVSLFTLAGFSAADARAQMSKTQISSGLILSASQQIENPQEGSAKGQSPSYPEVIVATGLVLATAGGIAWDRKRRSP